MIIASLILSGISLVLSMASIIWLLAKQFSSHKIEYINPLGDMKSMMDNLGAMGRPQGDEYRGMDEAIPADPDEFPKKR